MAKFAIVVPLVEALLGSKQIRTLRSPDIEPAVSTGEEDVSFSSSSSRRPGLDPFVQKALAELLEGAGGGIDNYKKRGENSLSKLLAEDTDTFGKRGDPIRDQISMYVSRWTKNPTLYNDKVLNI